MRAIGKRALVPVVLMLIGLGQLIYGAGFHSQSILIEQEPDAPPPMPRRFEPPSFIGPDGGPADFAPPPFVDMPPGAPSPPKTELIALAEPQMIHEVTIGGLTRLDTGQLKRTYSGAPPSGCPT